MTFRSSASNNVAMSIACLSFVSTTIWCGRARAQEAFGAANVDEHPATATTEGAHRDPSDWNPADPVPAGYHVEEHIRRNLVVRGAGLFVLMYVFSGATAASSSHEAPLWLPVAGPFIQLGQTSGSNAPGMVLLSADGLFQTAALAMMVYGLAVPTKTLVRDVGPVHVSLTPLSFGGGTRGVALVGTF